MRLRSLPQFEYTAPRDVGEVCSLLNSYGDKARLMAGGTDLLMYMKQRVLAPRYIIGLKNLPDLDGIHYDKGLRIGCLATHQTIIDNPVVRETFSALWTACSKVGTPNIRNMGTVGGNICNAAPSADSAPPLIAYDAIVRIVGVNGERSLPLDAFFVGPGKSALLTGEMLIGIDVPNPPARSGAVYVKLPARSEVDIAAVGVSAFVSLDPDNTCRDARIVLGAVYPTPIRVLRAEDAVKGEKITDPVIERAAAFCGEECCPISDVRGSAAYRSKMVDVLTRKALRLALAQAV